MKQKTNFDGAAKKFARCIYDSAKGKIRLAVLQRDLADLRNQTTPLKILDVGCGLGQMAVWFAQAGHDVTACDVSSEMIAQSQNLAAQNGVLENIHFFTAGLQELDDVLANFDLIICHAVLEWIEDQPLFIAQLAQRLAANGALSLMAFNKKALRFNHLIAGNFEHVQNGMQNRSRQRLGPNYPVCPDLLEKHLKINNLQTEYISGVRTFADYVRKKDLVKESEDLVLALELAQSQDPQFLPIARYLHYFLRGSDVRA